MLLSVAKYGCQIAFDWFPIYRHADNALVLMIRVVHGDSIHASMEYTLYGERLPDGRNARINPESLVVRSDPQNQLFTLPILYSEN